MHDPSQLTLHQSLHGYRFALEAFLLADFVPARAAHPFIDLGTGCGVVALLLARRFPHVRLVGLELQHSLAALAQCNVVCNGLEHRIGIVQGDIRQVPSLFPSGVFGTVVCNPPYRAVGNGRLNPSPEKAIARHELAVTLSQLVQAAQHLLCRRGLLVMVYHPSRLSELCARLETARLRPRRLRLIHATAQAPASMVLVEAVRDGHDALTALPPLWVYEPSGGYTAEMQAIFQGRAVLPAASKRALQAGATSLTEPADQFYGDRTASVQDPVGNRWSIATHREDVSAEELARRAEALQQR